MNTSLTDGIVASDNSNMQGNGGHSMAMIHAKGGVAIQIKSGSANGCGPTNYSTSGATSMQYNVHCKVLELSNP